MLKALYDYGIRNHVAVPPGFMRKPIRAYISLSAEGAYLGVLTCSEEIQVCPDVGSLANGPDKCNPLAEKMGVILDAEGKKGMFFRRLLEDGAGDVPVFGVCLTALQNEEVCDSIRKEMKAVRIKDQDRISFRVDGVPITAAEGVERWWAERRREYLSDGSGKHSGEMTRCLITGELTTPLSTLPAISGLQRVGGKALVPLFCFDKPAFCSYGLKKSTNAPVSEEAFAVVKDALNDLLAGAPAMYRRDKNKDFTPSTPVYAGMMFLHWYDCQIEPREDLILPAFEGFGGEDQDEDESLPLEEREEVDRQEEAQARARADQLVQSVSTGVQMPPLKTQYHILLISANSGRAVVRRYERGSYAELQKNLTKWNEEMALADRSGTSTLRPCKLFARLCRLIKDQEKHGAELYEQIGKELAGITPAIIMAILNGTPLPDAVAVRALAYIRSQMLGSREEEKKIRIPDGRACQWLKVWLARKRRARNEEVLTMPYYDSTFPSAAYHCGALTAIYANLQHVAMGEVNAGIVERYYASASRTPTLVLGTLERMGQVYLSMLAKQKDKRRLAKKYQDRLNETYAFFGKDGLHKLPAALTLEEQSFFALGYRQMCTQINADILAAEANKEEDA